MPGAFFFRKHFSSKKKFNLKKKFQLNLSGRHQAFASQELLGLKVAWNDQMFSTLHAEEDSLKLPHRVTLSQLLGPAGFIESLSSKYGHGMHLKCQTPQVLCTVSHCKLLK